MAHYWTAIRPDDSEATVLVHARLSDNLFLSFDMYLFALDRSFLSDLSVLQHSF